MKITNSAKSEEYSEKEISIEKLPNGEFKIIVIEENYEDGWEKQERTIEMLFSQNGFNALLGSMMAISGGKFYEK